MLKLYKILTSISAPFLRLLLHLRLKRGKEDANRLMERQGYPSAKRPAGELVWIHAASVGECQSALILIDHITRQKPEINFLVTSGTVTSAKLMAERLPVHALHQYIPLDHPQWVENFLTHWKPDLALWMESELWPNLLMTLHEKNISAILVNARLSDKSFHHWKRLKFQTKKLLQSFDLVLAQTDQDKIRYELLGAKNVMTAGNLKQSANPLPFGTTEFKNLKEAIGERPVWLYASTHNGEETLAARLHEDLKQTTPNILTIIVPRHPDRRAGIQSELNLMGLNTVFRGKEKKLPTDQTDIYIADTLGELGLFYTLSDIAIIGRSFSFDGGGGHNPVEAAQLNCAVITGPNIQFQEELFSEMFEANAAYQVHTEEELRQTLQFFLNNPEDLKQAIDNAAAYAKSKNNIIDGYMQHLTPFLTTRTKKAA